MKKSAQFIFMFAISLGTFIGYAPSLAEQWQTQDLPEQGLPVIHGLATSLPWNETWKNWKKHLQKTETWFYERPKNITEEEIKNAASVAVVKEAPTNAVSLSSKEVGVAKIAPLPVEKVSTTATTQEKAIPLKFTPASAAVLTDNPPPNRILLVGDSMAGSLGFGLKHFLRKTQIINKHRHSTGLTVQSYYNWPEQLKEIDEEARAEFIVSMLGTNDAQPILYKKKYYSVQAPEWEEAYTERATEWKKALDDTGKPYVVLGMPTMRDDYFDKRMQRINAIMEVLFGEHFLSLSNQLLDEKGHYDSNIRAGDGIHFAGGAINKVTELIIQKEQWTFTTQAPANTKKN